MGWEFDLLCVLRVPFAPLAHSQMKSLHSLLEPAVTFILCYVSSIHLARSMPVQLFFSSGDLYAGLKSTIGWMGQVVMSLETKTLTY